MSFRIGQRVHVGVSRFSHAWLKIHHPKTYTPAPKGDAYPQLSRSRKYPLSLWDNAGWTLLLFIIQVTARPLRLQVALTGKWFLLCMPREGGDRPADSRRYCYRASMYRGAEFFGDKTYGHRRPVRAAPHAGLRPNKTQLRSWRCGRPPRADKYGAPRQAWLTRTS